MNNIKRELEKIEIPKELNDRSALGVKQAKMEKGKKKKYPKWIVASVASVMIIGTGFSFGGSNIADATQSLISQLFGSKENLMQAYPDESQEEVGYFERHMKIAKENLTEEEFNNYSQLIKEQTGIWSKIRDENREPNEKEAARLHQIGELQESYTDKFALKEVQQHAKKISFTITKPTYLPEGYKQVDVDYSVEDVGEEPVVSLNYSDGEFVFWTNQEKINQKDVMEEMLETGPYEKSKTYSLNGLQFDSVSPKDKSASFRGGMRVTVPEKGYKIVIFSEILSKGEMEKVLLSMIRK